MTTTNILKSLRLKKIQFKDVLAHIDEFYFYSPSAFTNGTQSNATDENQGSARVLYFAQMNNLSQEDTLVLFAEHFDAVIDNPTGTDHQNIRQFQLNGWDGVRFESEVLKLK